MITASCDVAYAPVAKRCAFIAQGEMRECNYCIGAWPAGKGAGIGGRLREVGTPAVPKLRHFSSGIAAAAMSAS